MLFYFFNFVEHVNVIVLIFWKKEISLNVTNI